MNELNKRFDSFKTFPNQSIDFNKLASYWFYYMEVNDKIRCAHCGLTIENWGHDPVEYIEVYHHQHSPTCRMGNSFGNINQEVIREVIQKYGPLGEVPDYF